MMFLSATTIRRILPSLIALFSGGIMVLGFAPFSWFFIAPLAFAGVHYSLANATPREGFWRGWLFGIGLFGGGVSWIRISLNEFGNIDTWLAWLLTAVFIAVLALYSGVSGWLGSWRWGVPLVPVSADAPQAPTAHFLTIPAAYVLLEWLRGWLFTGFPWLNLGYSQLDAPLAGYAPIGGVYGVSLLVALSGSLIWGVLRWTGRRRLTAAASLIALWLGGAALQQVQWTQPSGAPFTAAVVQANIPQALKWTPEASVQIAQAYLELTREQFGVALILWPETALTDFLHEVREPLLTPLAARARTEGAEIVLGLPVLNLETGQYYNGLLSIGSREDLYTKRHLVPFGEFIPLRFVLGALAKWFDAPLSDFSVGTSARPLLHVGGWLAGASICYEDAFPGEVAAALPEAQFLINVSNDAWFGDSLAPHQHLQIARFRALETGRMLLRATNTGISAIIDERGRVLASVPTFQRGGASAVVQPRSGATPFVVIGSGLALSVTLALFVGGGVLLRHRMT
jgi:apolipoprotein N-acyltransferase